MKIRPTLVYTKSQLELCHLKPPSSTLPKLSYLAYMVSSGIVRNIEGDWSCYFSSLPYLSLVFGSFISYPVVEPMVPLDERDSPIFLDTRMSITL